MNVDSFTAASTGTVPPEVDPMGTAIDRGQDAYGGAEAFHPEPYR